MTLSSPPPVSTLNPYFLYLLSFSASQVLSILKLSPFSEPYTVSAAFFTLMVFSRDMYIPASTTLMPSIFILPFNFALLVEFELIVSLSINLFLASSSESVGSSVNGE